MKIYAYNENRVSAGHVVPGDKIERSEGDWQALRRHRQGLLDQVDSLDFTDGSPGRANAFHSRAGILVNRPWTLESELSILLPALAGILQRGSNGGFRLDWLAAEG